MWSLTVSEPYYYCTKNQNQGGDGHSPTTGAPSGAALLLIGFQYEP